MNVMLPPLLCAVFAASAFATESMAQPRCGALAKQHGVECHDADTKKGGVIRLLIALWRPGPIQLKHQPPQPIR